MSSMIQWLGVTLIFLLSTSLSLQDEWELAREENGIRVYTGEAQKPLLKPYRAEMIVNSPVDSIVSLLKDIPRYKDWVHLCVDSRLIEKISNDEFFVYYLTNSPWPVRNRDNCTRIRFERLADSSVWVHLKDHPGKIAEEKSVVRVPYMEGYWHLVPIDPAHTHVTHEVRFDPGGSVPVWIANMAVTDAPYNTLLNLRKLLE